MGSTHTAADSRLIVHPLSFGIRHPVYADVVTHLHKMNPGHIVDLLDPQTPMLLPHCSCGEQHLIYLEESIQDPQPQYRYRCASCRVATGWAPSRGHAKQLWEQKQTN